MKAIILAGGKGSRLYPLTQIASKQLQAVYDKPMIYYPITILIAAGIKDICLITTPEDMPRYLDLLGDGSAWGVNFIYRVQSKPEGIAQAFLIAADFIEGSNVVLMLGDNIFSGGNDVPQALSQFTSGATIFAYQVKNPEQYGVIEFDQQGMAISIEEKPAQPKSNYSVPGFYIYDHQVLNIARALKPSRRGELEITDINREYLRRNQLFVHRLNRGFAWLDAGTSSALQEASAYIEAIERRHAIKIGCPEEAAYLRKFISLEQFQTLIKAMPTCEYREYLQGIALNTSHCESVDSAAVSSLRNPQVLFSTS
jgi:glucose-1-phosphate thymidylyltransferase